MIYIINDDQSKIIKEAVEKDYSIRNLSDLKKTSFYEPLIKANEHQIPQSVVNREIAYLKCKANNSDQLSEFRKSNCYKRFATWAAGEIEMAARGLWLDMDSFEDQDLKFIFLFIEHLSRIAREKFSRRTSNIEKDGPGSEHEFRRAHNTAIKFLKINIDG